MHVIFSQDSMKNIKSLTEFVHQVFFNSHFLYQTLIQTKAGNIVLQTATKAETHVISIFVLQN